MSRIPASVIVEVDERADGYCEACGWPLVATSLTEGPAFHHRLPRSAGGLDVAVNLMQVHHSCHNVAPGSIHQNPARSYRLGHLVHRGVDPSSVPVIVAANLRALRA